MSIEELIKQAFLEGYDAGYINGGSDATSWEWGSIKHENTRNKERMQAWDESISKEGVNCDEP